MNWTALGAVGELVDGVMEIGPIGASVFTSFGVLSLISVVGRYIFDESNIPSAGVES